MTWGSAHLPHRTASLLSGLHEVVQIKGEESHSTLEEGCHSLFSKSGGAANNLLSREATLHCREMSVCYGMNYVSTKSI